jgi:hypothetical protein
MKKGVRSQSMASTIFSRIKKAGQRVKSIAASMAGGSNSGRSTFSMWRPGASSKGSGGNSASHHLNPGSTSTSQHGGSAAAGGTAMSLPGQAFGDGVAVVSAAAGSGHDHSQPRGTREHRTSRCTSELGSDVGDATGSHHSHQHRHGHSHEHHQHDRRPSGENRRSSTEDSRRPKGERRRSSLDLQTPASPPGTAAHAGPVAESASVLQVGRPMLGERLCMLYGGHNTADPCSGAVCMQHVMLNGGLTSITYTPGLCNGAQETQQMASN